MSHDQMLARCPSCKRALPTYEFYNLICRECYVRSIRHVITAQEKAVLDAAIRFVTARDALGNYLGDDEDFDSAPITGFHASLDALDAAVKAVTK